MKGLIHIYCGDGKGKTTCATGLAIRAAGNQMRVLFLRFLKNADSCELTIINQIKWIEVVTCPKDFGFFFQMSEEEKSEAKTAYTNMLLDAFKKLEKETYDMLVLDEIMAALNYGLIEETLFIPLLKKKPDALEVVLTGRNPSDTLLDMADYVSVIQKKKHPFDNGIGARKGIEM